MFVKGQSLYYLFLDCKALEEVGVVVNDDSQIETTVYEKKNRKKKPKRRSGQKRAFRNGDPSVNTIGANWKL